METKYLDCCSAPSLEKVKSLLSTEDVSIAIRRCRNCGSHWFYRMQEYEISGDEYDRRKWYVRLRPEEAEAFLDSTTAPEMSLFKDRDGFLRDENGMNKIHGIPDFLQK